MDIFLPPYVISENPLLRVEEPVLSLRDALALRTGLLQTTEEQKQSSAKLSQLSKTMEAIGERELADIEKYFGENGLFKMNLLFMKSGEDREFHHFWQIIAGDLVARRLSGDKTSAIPNFDNGSLPECQKLGEFRTNVIQPSFSRKIYNPGRQDGLLVYGLGGPRILVSHPFRGLSKMLYDVYENSVDVVTSLMTRGYLGTFMFLDFLPSLNADLCGVPEWVLWFSLISVHSDLVLFVKEGDQQLRESQLLESQFTPNRIPKKILEFKPGELRWATDYKNERIPDKITYIIPGKRAATQEEWNLEKSKLAHSFVPAYPRRGLAADRLFVIEETGKIREVPLPL